MIQKLCCEVVNVKTLKGFSQLSQLNCEISQLFTTFHNSQPDSQILSKRMVNVEAIQLSLFETNTEQSPPISKKQGKHYGWKEKDKLNERPGTDWLEDGFHSDPDPEPSKVAQDPWVSLANAVMLTAVLEAKAGDVSALHWLRSPAARLICEALDLSLENLQNVIRECEGVPARVLKRHEKTGLKRKAMRKYGAYAKD